MHFAITKWLTREFRLKRQSQKRNNKSQISQVVNVMSLFIECFGVTLVFEGSFLISVWWAKKTMFTIHYLWICLVTQKCRRKCNFWQAGVEKVITGFKAVSETSSVKLDFSFTEILSEAFLKINRSEHVFSFFHGKFHQRLNASKSPLKCCKSYRNKVSMVFGSLYWFLKNSLDNASNKKWKLSFKEC